MDGKMILESKRGDIQDDVHESVVAEERVVRPRRVLEDDELIILDWSLVHWEAEMQE